jgi:hypothetical protein
MKTIFAPTYVNLNNEKWIRVGPNTLMVCKRKCAYNDSGVCFYPGEVEIGIRCKRFVREEDKPAPEMPKDREEPNSGSGYRGWITATFYGSSQEEVLKKKEEYEKKYPPQGYSNYIVRFPTEIENGIWLLCLKRYSTCD